MGSRNRIAFLAVFAQLAASYAAGAASGYPQTYAEFERHAEAGEPIRIAVDLKQCSTAADDRPGPDIGGSFTPDGIMVAKGSTIRFASNHFTVHADGQSVEEFSAYSVDPDGGVTITTSLVHLPDYRVQRQFGLRCRLGDGVRFVGP